MYQLNIILSIVLLSSFHSYASVVPLRRQDASNSPDNKTANAMIDGLARWLGTQGVKLGEKGVHVLLPKDGMDNIAFLQSNLNGTDVHQLNATAQNPNNMIFQALDSNNDPSDLNSPIIHFSDTYKNFVQDVMKAVVPEGQPTLDENPDAKEIQNAYMTKCSAIIDILKGSLDAYKESTGDEDAKISDDEFIVWIQDHSVDYQNNREGCEQGKQLYNNFVAENYGNNYALFAGVAANMLPLINPSAAEIRGVTMQIVKKNGADDTSKGNAVPYYGLPGLANTVARWQEGTGLQSTIFSTENTTSESSSSQMSFGLEVGVVIQGIPLEGSASHSSSKAQSLTEHKKITVEWKSMTLAQIERGTWFDDFRMASALHSPPDDVAERGAEAFQKWFGTAEKPGQASLINDKAIIGYQPKVSIEFSSEKEAQEASETAASLGIDFGLFKIGGSASYSEAHNNSQVLNNTFVYDDQSQNTYLLGYVQRSFWDVNTELDLDTSQM